MLKRALRSRFLKDSAWLQASGAFTAVSALASSVIVSRMLGATELGRYFTAIALFSFGFLIVGNGIVHAAVGRIAMAISRGESEKAAGWIAFVAKSYAVLGVAFAAVGFVVFPRLGDLMFDHHQIGVWAFWLAFTPLLEVGRVIAYATFQGARRMRELAVLESTGEFFRLIGVTIGAWLAHTGAGPVIGTLGATLATSIFGMWLFRRVGRSVGHKLPSPRQLFANAAEVPVRAGLGLAFRVGLMRSVDGLALQVLPIMIIQSAGKLSGMPDPSALVGHFRVVQRIMAIPMVLLQGVGRTTLPALSAIAGRGDAPHFRRQFLRVTAWGGGTTTAGAVLTAALLPWIALAWPADFHEPIVRLGRILAAAIAVQGFAIGFESFYLLAQRLKIGIVLSVGWLLLSLPAMFLLVFHFPSTGAAWGIVACHSAAFAHLAYIAAWFKGGGPERVFTARTAG